LWVGFDQGQKAFGQSPLFVEVIHQDAFAFAEMTRLST
jgi:hypothetical protein